MYGDATVPGQPVRQPGRRSLGGRQHRLQQRLRRHHRRRHRCAPPRPRRQHLDQPVRSGRRRRQRRQRLRRRHPRLGLRRQQQHRSTTARRTTTARTSPAPSARVGGNGTGVAGVNWNVKMISAKFLGRRGGTTANAIKAVDYFTDLKTRHGLNIVATNNSWGGGGFSQGLLDAINRGGNAEHPVHRRGRQRRQRRRRYNNDATAKLPVQLPVHRQRQLRLRHRRRRHHQHRRTVELLQLRRDHGRPRCAGLGDLLHGADQAECSPTAPTAAPRWPRRT